MEKRINKIMEHYKLTPSQFADQVGVQRSSISHILSGRNKPSFDFMFKILTIFKEINANWLLLGEGGMIKDKQITAKSIIEQDLFNQPAKTDIKIENKSISDDRETLVDTELIKAVSQSKSVGKNDEIKQFTNVNSIKQIIFLYDNNTFEIINKK